MSLSLPKAELIGVFLESLAYGIYILIFLQCIQVLRRRQSQRNDYLFGTAVTLYILVTAHWVVDIVRNIDAFTTNMEIPNYPVTYYDIFDTWLNLLKSTLYVAVTILSDAFMLYRSFIVWRRNYLVAVIPFLLLLADIAIGILWVYTLSLIVPGENVYTDALSVRVKVFYSITLSLNVICTCLIALRIWKIQRAVAPYAKGKQGDLSRLVTIIVESGAVYSSMLVALIASYGSNSPVMFIFLNTMSPIIGAVFSSVIVRVGLGVSHGDDNTRSVATSSRSRFAARASARLSHSDQIADPSPAFFTGGGVQVALSHTVHTHVDGADGEDVETEVDMGVPDVKTGLHAV